MSIEETITTLGAIIASISAICAIVAFVLNRKKDGYDKGKDDGGIRGDIRYMRNGFDDLRLDVKEIARKQDAQGEKLAKVEERCNQAHIRIDHIEQQHIT